MQQTGMFEETSQKNSPRKRAPETLNPSEQKRLEDWAERVVPWMSREALECFETLDNYSAETLEWWASNGKTKANWVSTIMNRVRNRERSRLTRMARDGNKDAALALRSPTEWRDRFETALKLKPSASAETPALVRPKGGRVLDIRA